VRRIPLGRRSVRPTAGTGGRSGRRQVSVIVAGEVLRSCSRPRRHHDNSIVSWRRRSVASGLVPSINRPGGNITGVYHLPRGSRRSGWDCCTKWFPGATIAVLVNPNYSEAENQLREVRSGGPLGRPTRCRACQHGSDSMPRSRPSSNSGLGAPGLCIPILQHRREHLFVLAARPLRYRDDLIRMGRDFAAAGGLVSYGTKPWPTPIVRPASTPTGFSRRQTRRPADRAVDQVRVRDQP